MARSAPLPHHLTRLARAIFRGQLPPCLAVRTPMPCGLRVRAVWEREGERRGALVEFGADQMGAAAALHGLPPSPATLRLLGHGLAAMRRQVVPGEGWALVWAELAGEVPFSPVGAMLAART